MSGCAGLEPHRRGWGRAGTARCRRVPTVGSGFHWWRRIAGVGQGGSLCRMPSQWEKRAVGFAGPGLSRTRSPEELTGESREATRGFVLFSDKTASPPSVVLESDGVGGDVHLRLVLDLRYRAMVAADRGPELGATDRARSVELLIDSGSAAWTIDRKLGHAVNLATWPLGLG